MAKELETEKEKIARWKETIEGADQVGSIDLHFLDSGAFTQWTLAQRYAKEHHCSNWKFFDTEQFWDYMQAYVDFVKKYSYAIDYHANIDVIGNAELTLRNQKWLEAQGLSPVPVVHYKSPLKHLKHYLKEGYDYIGLGGLVGNMVDSSCQYWLDRAFNMICDNKKRLPTVRTHGFGVANFRLMTRYPWWSLDSAIWTKRSAFGGIFMPRFRQGKFVYDQPPFTILLSGGSPARLREDSLHYFSMSFGEQEIIHKWLDEIGVPLGTGKFDKKGELYEVLERGVVSYRVCRAKANLMYFEKFCQAQPEWPWPFSEQTFEKMGFGLLC